MTRLLMSTGVILGCVFFNACGAYAGQGKNFNFKMMNGVVVNSMLNKLTENLEQKGERTRSFGAVKDAQCEDFSGTWKGECIDLNQEKTQETITIHQIGCRKIDLGDGLIAKFGEVVTGSETGKYGETENNEQGNAVIEEFNAFSMQSIANWKGKNKFKIVANAAAAFPDFWVADGESILVSFQINMDVKLTSPWRLVSETDAISHLVYSGSIITPNNEAEYQNTKCTYAKVLP